MYFPSIFQVPLLGIIRSSGSDLDRENELVWFGLAG